MDKNQLICLFPFCPQVYDVQHNPVDPISIIRMAISGGKAGQFDIKQCGGLSKILGSDELPLVPEGQRHWSDGSMYIFLMKINPGFKIPTNDQ